VPWHRGLLEPTNAVSNHGPTRHLCWAGQLFGKIQQLYEKNRSNHQNHFKLEEVKDALGEIGIEGMTVTEVKGFGRQKRGTRKYTAAANTRWISLPKIKVELVVGDNQVDPAVAAIVESRQDGKNRRWQGLHFESGGSDSDSDG